MSSSPGRYGALLILCVGLALPLHSQEPSSSKQASSKSSTSDKKSTASPKTATDSKKLDAKKMDLSALPAEAILVPAERLDDILSLMPQAVILSPSKYQEMRDEIERLKKLLQTDRPMQPTRCDLRGKVEAGAVRLEVEFAGMVERANTLVNLACPQAGAASAQTDGRMALIRRTEAGGFVVQIEKAGEYHIKLELVLPLASREGNGRGFELTLPRAAITNLELELPGNSRDLRVGGRTLSDPELAGLTLRNHRLSGNPGLGPVDKLDLTWQEVRPASGAPVLTAEGRIQVRLDAAEETTEADLLLKDEGAPTKTWRLLVPKGAKVQVVPPDDSRVLSSIETAEQPYASLRTIHLKEPSNEPLHVQVTVSGPLPRNGSPTAVGPFFVLGAARQTGTVVVRSSLRQLHLDYRGHGDMRRSAVDETNGEATTMAFVYSNIPLIEKPQGFTGPNSLSWLDLEAETVHAPMRTRVSHSLILRPGTSREGLHWEILSTITPATKWTEVEQLKVFVPPRWKSADDSVAVAANSNPRSVIFPSSLLREAPSQPLRLVGRYEPTYPTEGRALLKLPSPQGLVEQCDVKIEAPSDSEVNLSNAEQADLELLKQTRPNEQAWRSRSPGTLSQSRSPEGLGIELSWRPYRPDLHVLSVVDLSLHGDRGEVRQELRLNLPPSPPSTLRLRVPPAVDRVEVGDERAPAAREALAVAQGVIQLPIPAKAGGSEWRLVLHYTTRLEANNPRSPGPFRVPLVAPERATSGDIKVRIWSEPGSLPRAVADPNWEEKNIEEVPHHADLPVLVLHSPHPDAALRLRVVEQDMGFSVLVERSLVRVKLLESGVQSWHVSYQLRQLAGQDLDIVLPGPVPTLNAQFFLNRRKVTPELVEEAGEHAGHIARLHLSPDLIRPLALLEVSFQSPPGRTGTSPLRTILQPPHLRGVPSAVPSRWLVTIPANRVLITPESAFGMERGWTRQGWLFSSHLQRSTGDLEREFEESLPTELRHNNERPDGDAQTLPALVCWQDHASPLTLTQAPLQAWLLVCSLGLLILGLGLYWAARPRLMETGQLASWFWPFLALLTLAAALGALFWPTTFWAIVYGCEPGALGLLSALLFQWLMHRRYRRQIVFLPSFSRSRPGSSLLRKSATPLPANGEPSTVDAPPPSGKA